jgi:hypothetical protein
VGALKITAHDAGMTRPKAFCDNRQSPFLMFLTDNRF